MKAVVRWGLRSEPPLVACLIAALVVVAALQVRSRAQPPSTSSVELPAGGPRAQGVPNGAHRLGSADAKKVFVVYLPINCPSCPQVWSDFGNIADTSVESGAAAWIVPVAHPDDPKLAALECTVIEGALWNLVRSDPHFQSKPPAMAERALVKNVPDFLDCVETRRMDFRVLGYIDAALQFIDAEDPVGFASSSGTLVPAEIEDILIELGER